MVGRKNQQLMQRRGRDQAQRFGLRKLAIGVVSVLLGTTIFLTGPSAMADTTATSTATTTAITSAATSTATSASSSGAPKKDTERRLVWQESGAGRAKRRARSYTVLS